MSSAPTATHPAEPGIARLTLSLTAATGLAGIILGLVSAFTMPISKENEVQSQLAARKEVLPQVPENGAFVPIEGKEGWFEGKDASGKTLGYVVKTEEKGYGGPVVLTLGVDPEFKVTDYRITKHNETPGLGENAKKEGFIKRFIGHGADQLEIVKRPPKDPQAQVQAITGATITSRAVAKAIQKALKELREKKGQAAAPPVVREAAAPSGGETVHAGAPAAPGGEFLLPKSKKPGFQLHFEMPNP